MDLPNDSEIERWCIHVKMKDDNICDVDYHPMINVHTTNIPYLYRYQIRYSQRKHAGAARWISQTRFSVMVLNRNEKTQFICRTSWFALETSKAGARQWMEISASCTRDYFQRPAHPGIPTSPQMVWTGELLGLELWVRSSLCSKFREQLSHWKI